MSIDLDQDEKELIEELDALEGWEERYQYLIDMGRELAPLKNPHHKWLIKGCQSKVWLIAKLEEGKLILEADADALLPKGIAALMLRLYSGKYPLDIVNSRGDFISKIGFHEFLSPIRANGMLAMLKQIKIYAQVFLAKEE